MAEWALLEADFHDIYGIDLGDVFLSRSWRWFQVRLTGLLATESRLTRHFRPDPEPLEADHE